MISILEHKFNFKIQYRDNEATINANNDKGKEAIYEAKIIRNKKTNYHVQMEIKNPKNSNSNEIEILTALSGCGDIQCDEKWNGAKFSYKHNYNTTHTNLEISVSGMVSHKMSLITIFGHKHKIKNFIKKFDIFHENISIAVGFWSIFGIKFLIL